MSGSIHAVIFDFGGVLGLPQDPERVAAMAALCGISAESLLDFYRHDRLELDRGTMSSDEYWGRLIARGGGAAPAPEVARSAPTRTAPLSTVTPTDERLQGRSRGRSGCKSLTGIERKRIKRQSCCRLLPPSEISSHPVRARE